MFSEISLPVPSQQMMMFRMVMLPRCYRSEYSEILGFWMTLRAPSRFVHGLPGVSRVRRPR